MMDDIRHDSWNVLSRFHHLHLRVGAVSSNMARLTTAVTVEASSSVSTVSTAGVPGFKSTALLRPLDVDASTADLRALQLRYRVFGVSLVFESNETDYTKQRIDLKEMM